MSGTTSTPRGLDGVVAAQTRMSMVDGQNGVLIIGGYELKELAGKVTLPKSTLLESSFNDAPLPMNNEAPGMFTAKSEPRNRAVVPSIDGSSTPDTDVRLRLMVALPKTTSAMLRPSASKAATVVTAEGAAVASHPSTVVVGIEPLIDGAVVSCTRIAGAVSGATMRRPERINFTPDTEPTW